MNAAEAREILKPPLVFGDAKQIVARKALESIEVAKEIIANCTLSEHFGYIFRRREEDVVNALEDMEDEILDCEECRAKIRAATGLHIDELLAAIHELFDDWWKRCLRA